MRKLILKMSVTTDGFVGGPGGEIDWIFRSADQGTTAWILETLWDAGIHIMGSRTFQDMMAYWPVSSEPFAAPMNQIPKMVFSRSTQQGAPASDAALTTAALQDATRRRSADSTRAHAAAAPPPPPPPPPPGASWSEARVARGELSEEVARLKNEPGKDILAHGGAGFAQSLVALRLVDEYRLLVHPVAIGRGHSLFASLAKPLDLRLVDIRAFASGVVAHVYRPD